MDRVFCSLAFGYHFNIRVFLTLIERPGAEFIELHLELRL